jgi:hypothetical protein
MKRQKNKIGSAQVHLLTVNNDPKGRQFISELRQSMKGTPNHLVLYGRGHRFGKGRIHINGQMYNWDNSYQSRIPLDGDERAQRIAVYITSR